MGTGNGIVKATFSLHNAVSTISAIVSILVVVMPLLWVVLSPLLVSHLSDAMAGDITAEVAKQIAPTNQGIATLIQGTIAELEDEISALEYKQTNDAANWTSEDMQRLTTKRRRLRSQQSALAALIAASP